MRLLIDTHVFLWFIAGDQRLSQTVRAALEADENTVLRWGHCGKTGYIPS